MKPYRVFTIVSLFVVILLLCGCVAECKITSAYDCTVVEKKGDLNCGEKVQLLSDRTFMSCWRGPSPRGFNGGGAILWRDTVTGNQVIDRLSNKSRGKGFGHDFVVKDARGQGGGINMGALFNAANQFFIRLHLAEYFIDIDGGWVSEESQIDMSQDGGRVVVGSPWYDSGRGLAKYYKKVEDSYHFESNIFPSDHGSLGQFGAKLSMTLDGNVLAISSPNIAVGGANGAGKVFAFHYDPSNDSYLETQDLSFNASYPMSNRFGRALALSSNGSKLIVCSWSISFTNETSSEGACVFYAYTPTNQSYSYTQTLQASDQRRGNRFGYSIAISSNEEKIAVGCFSMTKAYLFQYQPISYIYSEIQTLAFPSLSSRADSVDLSSDGNTLLVGIPKRSLPGFLNAGGSLLFQYSTTSYSYERTHEFFPDVSTYVNTITLDRLTITAAVDGGFFFQSYVASSTIPSSYFFLEDDLLWKSYPVVVPSGLGDTDNYGYAIAYSTANDLLAVSAPQASSGSSGAFQGVVYLFTFDEASSRYRESYSIYGNTRQAFVKFGSSLAFHPNGGVIAIGCGQLNLNGSRAAGGVFVYSLTETSYSQLAMLSSPNSSAFGYYGSSVFFSTSYLGVGAMEERLGSDLYGKLHLYAVNDDLTDITFKQTFYKQHGWINSEFGATSAILPDESKIVVGAPRYSRDRLNRAGAVILYAYDGIQFVEYDLIIPLDVQEFDEIGNYFSISSDGNQILIGSPSHDVNGEVKAGQVYHYVEVGSNTCSRLNGSTHYALEEVLFSPDGVIARSQYGMGVSIHPTLNITLIGCGLSNREGRDRPTVFIYDDDPVVSSTSGSCSAGDDPFDSFPLASLLVGLGGGYAGLSLLTCFCFCCVMLVLCVVFLVIIF